MQDLTPEGLRLLDGVAQRHAAGVRQDAIVPQESEILAKLAALHPAHVPSSAQNTPAVQAARRRLFKTTPTAIGQYSS